MTQNTPASTHIRKQSFLRPNNTRRTCFNDTAVCRIANVIFSKSLYEFERTIWCLALTVMNTIDTHSHTYSKNKQTKHKATPNEGDPHKHEIVFIAVPMAIDLSARNNLTLPLSMVFLLLLIQKFYAPHFTFPRRLLISRERDMIILRRPTGHFKLGF